MKTMSANAYAVAVATMVCLIAAVPARSVDPALFAGEWCNKDFNTRGNTRIHIFSDGEKLMVRMWGRCHPTECDWGLATAASVPDDANSISIVWDQEIAVSSQKLTLQQDGSLKLTGTRTYKDPKRRVLKEVETFQKGLKHDWSDAGAKK